MANEIKTVVEELCSDTECSRPGIVRGGPDLEKFGDSYDYAVAFKRVNGKAIIKALVRPVVPRWLSWFIKVPPLTRIYVRALNKALKDIDIDWERKNHGS